MDSASAIGMPSGLRRDRAPDELRRISRLLSNLFISSHCEASRQLPHRGPPPIRHAQGHCHSLPRLFDTMLQAIFARRATRPGPHSPAGRVLLTARSQHRCRCPSGRERWPARSAASCEGVQPASTPNCLKFSTNLATASRTLMSFEVSDRINSHSAPPFAKGHQHSRSSDSVESGSHGLLLDIRRHNIRFGTWAVQVDELP